MVEEGLICRLLVVESGEVAGELVWVDEVRGEALALGPFPHLQQRPRSHINRSASAAIRNAPASAEGGSSSLKPGSPAPVAAAVGRMSCSALLLLLKRAKVIVSAGRLSKLAQPAATD